MLEKGQKASVTFRVTPLLGTQQRWASLQRAPVAGVPYLLALSKPSLTGGASVRTSGFHDPISAFESKLLVNFRLSGIHLSGDCSHPVPRIKRSMLVGAQFGSWRKADIQ